MSDFPTARQAREKAQDVARRKAQIENDEANRKRITENERLAKLVPMYEDRFRREVREHVSSAMEGGSCKIEWVARDISVANYEAVARAARTVEQELVTDGYKVKNRTHYTASTRDPDDGMVFGPYLFAILEVEW